MPVGLEETEGARLGAAVGDTDGRALPMVGLAVGVGMNSSEPISGAALSDRLELLLSMSKYWSTGRASGWYLSCESFAKTADIADCSMLLMSLPALIEGAPRTGDKSPFA